MVIGISIHALREEGDTTGKVDTPEFKIFLSTPSARRATSVHRLTPVQHTISIHALREEGDVGIKVSRGSFSEFLSTPSARRATLAV